MKAAARLALGLAALFAACAGDIPSPPDPASLVIENASQYVLEELRIHAGSSYLEAPNLLEQPLVVGGRFTRFGEGSFFVTVMRERFRGGETLALTTMYPVALDRGLGYRLLVFDASFRLEPATLIVRTSTETP